MAQAKTLRVQSGKHFVLNAASGLTAGANIHSLRPRTVDALKTLFFMVDRKPERLQDPKAFERMSSFKGLVELAPDKSGKVGGISGSTLIQMVRAIPLGAKVPPTVQWSMPHRGCSCHGAGKVAMNNPTGSLGLGVRNIVLPDWLQRLQVYLSSLLFQDIIVEKGAVLTIDPSVSYLSARHFVLHTGGRVNQGAAYLNVDLSGSFSNTAID
jgi:hypothetical protein